MKKTVTIIRASYLQDEILIAVIEDFSENRPNSDKILGDLSKSKWVVVKTGPLWINLSTPEDTVNFIDCFRQSSVVRKPVYLSVTKGNTSLMPKIFSDYTDWDIPDNGSYRIPVILKNMDNTGLYNETPEKAVLRIEV